MKINKIIKSKRKEKNLTQEELANRLGVSTPAVSKWESGISYPDITILPPLARILDTDLNTLLSFKEDLTREEIGNIINEVSETMQSESFETGYKLAMDKIKEFPNNYQLIYNLALVLEGSIYLYSVDNREEYKMEIYNLYNRALESDEEEIKYEVVQRLSAKYIEEDNFDEAERLLDSLPDITYNKNIFKGVLYSRKKEYDKAFEIYEREILNHSSKIITTLLSLMEISLKTNRTEDTKYYVDIMEKTSDLFELWEYNKYIGHFQLAVSMKDEENTLKYLKLVLKSMDDSWNIKNTKLYKDMSSKENNSTSTIKSMMLKAMVGEEEFSFIEDNMEFKKIIENNI